MVDDKSSKEKDSKEKDFKANATLIGKVASTSASISASASGSSSRSSSSRGKGKERERGDSVNASSGGGGQTRNEDDGADGRESFLPTYVYDAMKVKKRFEHMRVSVFSCFVPFLSSFFVLHSSFVPSCCIPPVYSMLISL